MPTWLIAHDGARVTGTAAYNLKTTAFRFNLKGSNFSLAQFAQLQLPRISVGGTLNFDARGSGTTSAPVVDADLHVRDVMLNRERLGNLDAKAVTSAGVMRITAQSDFPAAEFGLDGTVGMHGDFPAELALKFTRLDVDALLHEFLQGRITGHSSISGAVTLAGPLRRPRLLTVNGDISQFSADMENVQVHNDGPLRFKVADQVLTLEQFHLAGEENTQLSATGTVSLAGAKALDLRAEGNVHLKLLQVWNPDLHTGGTVEFNINARGTMEPAGAVRPRQDRPRRGGEHQFSERAQRYQRRHRFQPGPHADPVADGEQRRRNADLGRVCDLRGYAGVQPDGARQGHPAALPAGIEHGAGLRSAAERDNQQFDAVGHGDGHQVRHDAAIRHGAGHRARAAGARGAEPEIAIQQHAAGGPRGVHAGVAGAVVAGAPDRRCGPQHPAAR